ncbi:hypothetical protein F0562_000969 [Nyssa sinensis]|uniref:Uncharacterized protein n=1 Tax=Nyssa sinensis TaxID=561372 RepID=A0A5J5C1N2_9ASTE|nr:hypothetical protein F0562_000969 [Nyssa sinensis]
MQRLAHIFANGIEARLAGTGSQSYSALASKRISAAEKLKAYQLYLSACPFKKIAMFFANKLIFELAAKTTKKKLHIIDFGILYGFQWPMFFQHLSTMPGGPPQLRITGIELPQPGFRPAELVEETGRRLAKYCERFNIPFQYHAIAQKWETINIEDLKIDSNEVLAVNCLFRFKNLLDETVVANSPRDAVLKLIRNLNPDIFIHSVVNGSYNAPFFVTRFREALFYYSAWFDMFDTNLSREDLERSNLEKEFYGREVMNVVACEGSERVERPETYKQWQARNMRAGFRLLPLNLELVNKLRELRIEVPRVSSGAMHVGIFLRCLSLEYKLDSGSGIYALTTESIRLGFCEIEIWRLNLDARCLWIHLSVDFLVARMDSNSIMCLFQAIQIRMMPMYLNSEAPPLLMTPCWIFTFQMIQTRESVNHLHPRSWWKIPTQDDFSDADLKYLNQALMDDDLEDKACMIPESALRAAEKSFYDMPCNYRSGRCVNANSLAKSGLCCDLGKHSHVQNPPVDHAFLYDSLSLCPLRSSSETVDELADSVVNAPLETQSVSQFEGGIEEPREFLTSGNYEILNLENNRLVPLRPKKKLLEVEANAEKDEGDISSSLLLERKNLHQEENYLEDKRSKKHLAACIEESVLLELFCKALLVNGGNDESTIYNLDEHLQNGVSKEFATECASKRF